MFIEVVKATYLDGYRVKLLFNNGETKIVDLSQSLNGAVFVPRFAVDVPAAQAVAGGKDARVLFAGVGFTSLFFF